jgi:hypothetical protein
MRLLLLLLGCSLVWSGLAQAQYLREYVFVGPTPVSASTPTTTPSYGILPPTPLPITVTPPTNNWYTAGFGLEGILVKHVGAGLDLAGILPGQGKIVNNTIGSASFNGYGHVFTNSKWDVYGTGGYSLLFRNFTANYYNVGGGLNYWLGIKQTFGLMFEYRYLHPFNSSNPSENTPYNEIRFGFTMRQK